MLDLVQRWAAAELAGDVGAYGQLLTADFTGVGPAGFVLTGEQWASRHLGDLHNEKFEVLDPHATIYGDPPDTVVIEAAPPPSHARDDDPNTTHWRPGMTSVQQDISPAAPAVRLAAVRSNCTGAAVLPGEMYPCCLQQIYTRYRPRGRYRAEGGARRARAVRG